MENIMTGGILLFGANGSGKTALGRELAKALHYKHIDVEDYSFLESQIPIRNRARVTKYSFLF